MAALRICACGAELREAGDALYCSGCGARARTWRVVLDGRAVAVGAAPARGTTGGSKVALTHEFEAHLLELRDGSAEPIRYAVPSSWRRGYRRRHHHAGR